MSHEPCSDISHKELQSIIETTFETLCEADETTPAVPEHARDAVFAAIDLLDHGTLRVAEKQGETWHTHAWLKKAILLYFRMTDMQEIKSMPFEFHDKIPLKKDLAKKGVRLVPPGVIRHGAYVGPNAVVMPGYVNIGAWVGSNSMIDTWATVGSCAQVGKNVHVSGGVGIGGVLEPPQAQPVIIEDGVFLGSRAVVVEGMLVEKEAVLGAGVVLTSSTAIVDVTERQEVISRGRIPARSVVIPGMRERHFAAGTYHIPCALIIGQRSFGTDLKTSLEDALRRFAIPV